MSSFNNRARVLIAGTLFAASACGGSTAVPSGGAPQLAAAAIGALAPVDSTSILKKLNKKVEIGSTIDSKNGDRGPRKISLVESTFVLQKGQLLVCNFENSAGTTGKGTTIEVLNPKPNSKPVTFTQNAKINGCDGDAVTESNQVYGTGRGSNFVSQFDQTGALKKSYKAFMAAPFDDADAFCGLPYAPEDIYVANSQNGSIVKVAFTSVSGRTKLTQVISGFAVNKGFGWGVLGPSGMQYNNTRIGSLCNDTLYIVDGVDNTIVAVSTASNLLEKDEIVVQPGGKKFKCAHPSKTCAKLVFSGPPLNAPVASTLLPNGNLIVANTKGGNTLVELTPTGKILATKTIDTSTTPHIFGLMAAGTNDSDTVLFYTDTATNTLQELTQ